MRITFPQYFQYKTPLQTFKSNENEFFDSNGNVVNKTVTYFFRNDLEWEEFAKFLEYKYKNEGKVNITDYAASDGSEAYTLVMSLKEFAPSICDKTFPIIAKDKFQTMVDEAQSGICNIYDDDIYAINYFTRNKFNAYFQARRATNPDCPMAVSPKTPLQDKIIFTQADILNDLENLPDSNNVILCRNCWKYFSSEHYDKLAEQLYEKTKDNGVIVIGEVEEKLGIPELLRRHGFQSTGLRNVYLPVTRMMG